MINELRELEEKGYVRGVSHHELPLLVWNYTPVVQFDKLFGEYPLLRQCRGLITDTQGNIVGRGFNKFFNWEEHALSEFPDDNCKIEVTEKMDGSLLIVCKYQGQTIYSTRGSFYSDQAIAGAKLFKDTYDESWIEEGKTYLFEYTSPENRIVVSYEKPELIHIAVLDNSNGWDLPRDTRYKCVPVVEIEGTLFKHIFEGYSKLKSLNSPNKEGFVIRSCSDGTFPDWRCKIKFDDYIKLHRIVTGVSNKTIWEMLRDGTSLDQMIEICPDEFNDWLRKVKYDLEEKYSVIHSEAIKGFMAVEKMSSRKEQAQYLLEHYKNCAGIVFSMLDGKNYSNGIWSQIKPEKYIQPFANKGEE